MMGFREWVVHNAKQKKVAESKATPDCNDSEKLSTKKSLSGFWSIARRITKETRQSARTLCLNVELPLQRNAVVSRYSPRYIL